MPGDIIGNSAYAWKTFYEGMCSSFWGKYTPKMSLL